DAVCLFSPCPGTFHHFPFPCRARPLSVAVIRRALATRGANSAPLRSQRPIPVKVLRWSRPSKCPSEATRPEQASDGAGSTPFLYIDCRSVSTGSDTPSTGSGVSAGTPAPVRTLGISARSVEVFLHPRRAFVMTHQVYNWEFHIP